MKFHLMRDFNPVLVTENRIVTHDPRHSEGVENRHDGWLALYDIRNRRRFETPGTDEVATFIRSAAKPFQATPLIARGYHSDLSTEALALLCASHTASAAHLRAVHEILAAAEMGPDALGCGPHAPLDAETAETLRQAGAEPQPIHNNCSGKHAGMLLYCRRAGLDPHTYLQPDHPLQQEILSVVRAWGGVSDVPLGIDGCGAPVFYMPIRAIARMFAYLGEEALFAPLAGAMAKHPVLVGGEGRIDTVLMQVSRGALLAKVGADGLIGVSRVARGEGLALKIASGSAGMRAFAVVQVLLRLGWLDEPALNDPRLGPFIQDTRTNTLGQTVGHMRLIWPEGLDG